MEIPGAAGATGKPPMPPGAGAPGAPTPDGDAAAGAGAKGPVSSPMSGPEPMQGLKSAARVNITMAMDLLSQSLPPMGADSDEGKAILNALKTLSKAFGKTEQKSRELIPAEIMQMLSGLPQSNPSPGAKAAAAAPVPGAGAPPIQA